MVQLVRHLSRSLCYKFGKIGQQQAQLPQRNSASAAHVYLRWLTDRAMPEDRRIADVQLDYSQVVSTVSAKCTLR